ncbi:hypothetical protein D3218_13060 [Aureimonas flava]|uniref:Uncharacterized protein n=1 Tax=Aureimonas flava TaxID=2320271 RepID=A0A3A1WJZ9_9HYPH|nr:hypothetical protein [Aureimonas flava]RIY00209.1 hypothetical protein D3218_13060 [Aureimonas flava]
MTDITNNSGGPIGLPNGQVIQPKATVDVQDWDDQSGHVVVKAWLKAKVLTTGKPAEPEQTGDGRDENGDTPEMAEMRKRFDASYAQAAGEIERLNGELAARDATIMELQASQASQASAGPAAGGEGEQDPPKPTFSVKDKGRGWFAIVDADGNEVTKSLRDDAVEGFDAKSDEDKAAFVDANKAD